MRKATSITSAHLPQIQSFYAVAKHGSLGAAARAGGGSIPTLSRHITMLERDFNITLFDRRGDGLALTETGTKLYEHAAAVQTAGLQFSAAAAGTANDVSGTVRISASRHFANFILPDVLCRLGDSKPELDVELVVTDVTSNLLMREADIAVRMHRPEQTSLFAKKVGEVALGAYASREYVARNGEPNSLAELKKFDVIGDAGSPQINAELSKLGLDIADGFFRYVCDDPSVAWRLVLAGCGIGLGYITQADRDDRVKRVLADAPELTRSVWLVSHAELKTSAKVRAVYDVLSEELGRELRRNP